MSIAIVIIVTIFGARSTGEVLCSSGTQCVVQRNYASWGGKNYPVDIGLMLIIISYFWLYLEASEEYY